MCVLSSRVRRLENQPAGGRRTFVTVIAFVTDDIFDHSDLRYGHATLYKKYGVSYAIIAAELMQSAALRAISQELERGRFANTLSVTEIFDRVVFDL